MLFDPSVLLREPLSVIGALALIMVGKSLIAFVIVIALRYPIGIGLTVSASLAQIGEFSFILAGLGISLGLLSREGQDLILAAAILSIILNPLAFMASDALQKAIRSAWPSLWATYGKQRSDELDHELQRIRELSEERDRQHHLEMQKLIKTFPLFSQVDEHSLDELLLLFKPSSASPGDRVVRKGDRGDGMYFIAAGAVEVKLDSRAIRLEAGSFFGEMALLSGERRIADVVAIDFCEFLVLQRRDFNRFVAKHPELRAAVDNMASQRRQTNTALREEA
jgi:CPA2 family monovalent cation:H+ antiporter-2